MSRLTVGELWRYPVKSLQGEPLTHAELGPGGMPGDRLVHVSSGRGLLTGRTRHRLLHLSGATGPDGIPLVEGHAWDSEPAAALVEAAAGPGAHLRHFEGPERFDVLPLLVVADAEVRRLGHDRRRLRPNLVIAGALDGEERTWVGKVLQIGEALVGVYSPRQRCIVTTIDPDTGEQNLDVLRTINRQFGGRLGLDCWVVEPGAVHEGDQVRVAEGMPWQPPSVGGWVVGAPYPVVA